MYCVYLYTLVFSKNVMTIVPNFEVSLANVWILLVLSDQKTFVFISPISPQLQLNAIQNETILYFRTGQIAYIELHIGDILTWWDCFENPHIKVSSLLLLVFPMGSFTYYVLSIMASALHHPTLFQFS